MNTFQGGTIYWSPATGAHVVYGGIGGKYNPRLGGTFGTVSIGLPTSDEANVPGVPGVRVTTSRTVIHLLVGGDRCPPVYGGIGAEYAATANEGDAYGTVVQRILGAHQRRDECARRAGRPHEHVPGRHHLLVAGDRCPRRLRRYRGRVQRTPSGRFTAWIRPAHQRRGRRARRAGSPRHHFQGGAIYWSAATGAHRLWRHRGRVRRHRRRAGLLHTVIQRILGAHQRRDGCAGRTGRPHDHVPGRHHLLVAGDRCPRRLRRIGAEYAATANERDAYGTVVQRILGMPTSDEAGVPGPVPA